MDLWTLQEQNVDSSLGATKARCINDDRSKALSNEACWRRHESRGSKKEPNEFHASSVQYEEDVNAGLREEDEQAKMEDLLRLEVELQTNYLLCILFLVLFECAIALVNPLRRLAVT